MALLPGQPKQSHHHCVICWTEIDTTPRNKVPVFDESFISASGDEEEDARRIFVKREVDDEVAPRQDDKENADNRISRQLRVIFILRKVLEVPVESLAGYLGQWGSPEEWIRLCEDCGQDVDKAWNAYQQILGKIGEFAEIRKEIVGKVKSSAFDSSGGDREETIAIDVRSIANKQIYGSVTVSYSDNHLVTPLVPKREVDIEEFLLEQEAEDEFNLDQEEEPSWNAGDDELSDIDNFDDNWHSAEAEDDDGNNLSEPEQEHSTICQLCGKNCLRKQGLLIHLSKIHKIREPVEQDKEKQWICKVNDCKASFILKRSWRTHYRSVHGRESKQEIFAKQKQLKAVSATATSIPTYPIPKDEYTCEVCGKSYSGHQGLALHRTRIHGLGIKKSKSGKYLCEVEGCGKELAFSQSWRAHRRWHMKQSHIILDTDYPKDTTTSTDDYQQSFELTEAENDQDSQEETLPFKCDICGTEFSHSQGLAVHRTRKHGLGIKRSESGKYLCEVEGCGKELSWAQSWNAHRKWHERKSKKRRIVPVASVEDPDGLIKELRMYTGNNSKIEDTGNTLEDITEFKCSLCGKSYSNQQGLSLHRTKIHGLRLQANNGFGKFLCEVENCGQEFTYKQSWKAHMKKHFSKPQHKCDVCGREFYEAQSYRYHMGCHKRNSIPTSYSSGKKLPGRKRKIGLKCPMEITSSRQAQITKPKLKGFRRGLCGQEFRKKSSLVYHEKSHEQQGADGRIEFPCPEANCGKVYENVKSLWIHIRCHKNRPRFPCSICGKKFTFQSKLDRHLKNCHNSSDPELENLYAKVKIGDEWIYECKVERCGRKFVEKVAVQRHLKKHTSQANYKCAICGREFVSAYNFQGHLEAHDRNTISREFHGKQGPGRVVPEISDKSITVDAEDPINKASTSTGVLEEEIISPIETDNEKDLNLKCPHCKKECHSKQGLQNHINRKHSGLKSLEQFTCPVEGCSKVYSRLQRNVFYNHVKSHKQARYRCAVCGKEFYWRTHLLSHKQMHNRLSRDTVKPRSYVCDLCGKGFVSASSLKWHKEESKAHQEYATKFKCKFCEVEFEKRHECSLHELTHELSGDKVEAITTFQCNLCGKTFKKEGYLKGHIRFVHEKKFKVFCELCGKGLVCNRHLVLHKKQAHKIDEEVETFKCEVVGCKRVFHDKRNFKEHQTELHGNEDGGEESKKEPFFSCQQCGRAFWHVHQLKKHIRRTHDETRPRMRKRRSVNEINEGTSDLISSQYFQDS